jgi:two-component system response regulator HydG
MDLSIKSNNILIVDDTPENLTVLRKMLAVKGYRVRTALGGKVALKTVMAEPPDLILLDILMPEMDGYEVCNALKANPISSKIPIIFISALTETENVLQAFKTGGVDYIAKPFKTDEVLARVRTHLELKHAHLELQNAIREKNESHLMLQTILESIENIIVTVDDKLQIINTNRELDTICDCMPGDEISFQEYLNNGKGPLVDALLNTFDSNKPIKELRVDCKCGDGTEKTLVLNTAPLIRSNNESSGAVLVIRDISRLASLEKNLLEKHSYRSIIGKSESMQKVYSLLERVVDLDVNVLVCGDSGTGKELVAEAIHYGGTRAAGPLVKVNCAALSENLLESELFGHVRGAFTGAIKDRIGRCKAAEGGTLFLDEIGDISPQFQAKLLRFLEQKEFERLGDSKTLKADVRVVAATNHDLAAKVSENKFREDLFYRLKGILIQLPALKERIDDIPLLMSHFIRTSRKTQKKNIEEISDDVTKLFMEYRWPGNVRELKSAMEYACAICPGEIIHREDLPSELFSDVALEKLARRKTDSTSENIHEQRSEKGLILDVLEKTAWNKAKAARLLGMGRTTLYAKLLKYGIKAEP